MKYIAFVGRLLFSILFIVASAGHFSPQTIDAAARHGVPLAALLVPVSGVIALTGGLSVLVGFRTRFGALLLVLFLIPVSLLMHNFWAADDPNTATNDMINFTKNLALLGATLMFYGIPKPWPRSLGR